MKLRSGLRRGLAKMNKTPFHWLHWKHVASREARTVVKGTHRRIVVVKSPDPRIFEEAIFIIREDFLRQGSSPQEVLEEARRAANEYVKTSTKKKKKLFAKNPGPLLAVAGAAAAGLTWLTVFLSGA